MSDDLAARLREQGLRLTPQRQLILRAVEELGHATPDEVLAHVRSQVSSVNASTVYRTLEVLEELGLVRHTHLSDRAPTYHSTREHEHVHVVCRRCHAVRSYDPDGRRPRGRGAGPRTASPSTSATSRSSASAPTAPRRDPTLGCDLDSRHASPSPRPARSRRR